MRFEPTPERVALEEYLRAVPAGTKLSFLQIEHETGVRLDESGMGKLRRSLAHQRIEYIPVYGYGIQIADAGRGLEAVSVRTIRIDGAVKRAERAAKNVTDRFYDEMSPADQKQMRFLGATFGAIRLCAAEAKKAYNQRQIKPAPEILTIPIPQVDV